MLPANLQAIIFVYLVLIINEQIFIIDEQIVIINIEYKESSPTL